MTKQKSQSTSELNLGTVEMFGYFDCKVFKVDNEWVHFESFDMMFRYDGTDPRDNRLGTQEYCDMMMS